MFCKVNVNILKNMEQVLLTSSKTETLRRLKALEDISYTCSNLFSSNLREIGDQVLEYSCKLTGADYGLLFFQDPSCMHVLVAASYGLNCNFRETYNNKLRFRLGFEEAGEVRPSFRAMLSKEIIILYEADKLNIGSSFFRKCTYPNKVSSLISIPIIIDGKAVAAISQYFIEAHDFNEEELSFIKTTANIITSTIERNQLLEKAQKSNEELKFINKELDSFVFIASHDLREPLRTIESFVKILEHKLNSKLDFEDNYYLTKLVWATQKERKLIEDLTLLSRATKDTINSDVVDLNIVLKEVKFELAKMIEEKNAEIVVIEKLPCVSGNKEKVASIFKNLISNGIKFNKSQKPCVKVYVDNDANFDPDKISVCFEDNGIGIKEEHFEKIFNLFQRLHSEDEYEGTGAGLAIVKKILEKYGCKIWLESEEEKGSRFFVTLPIQAI